MFLRKSNLAQLLLGNLPETVVGRVLEVVEINRAIAQEQGDECSRAVLAEALNLALLADLMDRVPTGRAYMDDVVREGRKLIFDHGAVRTGELEGMGGLPSGREALARVLVPLGYVEAETYPLDRLKMTGRAFRHLDFPEDIPQFFVSELHVDRFSPEFRAAAARVTESSSDPLDEGDKKLLAALAKDGKLATVDAIGLLGKLIACFTRRHAIPALSDYEQLLAESAEMAWIATEGNAFNHATDRVPDLDRIAEGQRALGRAIKDRVEVSGSGRVRQTAYRADPAERNFMGANGETLSRMVPGSFFEFIQRDRLPDESALDLSFDTGNAQGIFKMTATAA